jgi:hypothetical protein
VIGLITHTEKVDKMKEVEEQEHLTNWQDFAPSRITNILSQQCGTPMLLDVKWQEAF